MRKLILAAALTAAISAPAYANEGRIEARGGVYWESGFSKGTAGVALGYDWDLGSAVFAGLEVSGDKILTNGTRISFGATGRLGVKAGPATKIYVDGGYTSKPCRFCDDAVHAGIGVEQNVTKTIYLSAEYRHFFIGSGIPDANAIVGGVGVNF